MGVHAILFAMVTITTAMLIGSCLQILMDVHF